MIHLPCSRFSIKINIFISQRNPAALTLQYQRLLSRTENCTHGRRRRIRAQRSTQICTVCEKSQIWHLTGVKITVNWGHGTSLLWAAAKRIIAQITGWFEDGGGRKSKVYRSIHRCGATTQSRYETKRILTQLTQITFISAANCEGLRVTQTRGVRGRKEGWGGGHRCDSTVSLTHPSEKERERVGGQGGDPWRQSSRFPAATRGERESTSSFFTDYNRITSENDKHICLSMATNILICNQASVLCEANLQA